MDDKLMRLPVGETKLPDGRTANLYVREDGRYEAVSDGQVVDVDAKKAAKEHLEVLIKASGLTREKFAVAHVARNESTLRRWTAGKVPIPRTVIQWMFRQSLALAAGRDLAELESLDQMLGIERAGRHEAEAPGRKLPGESGGGRTGK